MRTSSGRFRQATLRDFGMAACDRCGSIYTPDLSHLEGTMIDPRDLAAAMRKCPTCDGAQTIGNVFVTKEAKS
jgi:hypothetical protein